MLNISKCFPSILRNFSTVQASNFLEPLTNRKIIRVSGSEVSDFLQGLITNDIHHLDHGIGSMYAMFLNTKGRVLYDTLIYKSEEKDTYLIECDIDALGPLQRHLKMYRVRRKIDITSLEKEINVFALFNPENVDYKDGKAKRLDGIIVPCDALNETQPDNGCTNIGEISIFSDPRVVALGARILAPDNCDVLKEISKAVLVNTQETPSKNYKQFRYNLGVGEGVTDLPPDNCFPLEANCDYLHGVSFHKGCYIGQELTARTHHTGVVRKRLMPLFFNNDLVKIPEDKTILNETVNLGKLRGVEGKTGLALLRIVKAIGCENIKIGNCLAKTEKPNWWPIEAPKEKMSA